LIDYEMINSKMNEKNCQRAVVIVDHTYLDYGDHQLFLNPKQQSLGGVASGNLAFVASNEFKHVLAHELAHTLGVYHSNDIKYKPVPGYKLNQLNGIDVSKMINQSGFIISNSTIDFMWGKTEIDLNTGMIIKDYWTQYRHTVQLYESIQENTPSIAFAPQFMISLTGIIGQEGSEIESVETKIVQTSISSLNTIGSQYQVVTLDSAGNEMDAIGISTDFDYSAFINDPYLLTDPQIQLSHIPIAVLIPFNDKISQVMIKKGNQILKIVEPSNEQFTLREALKRIPDNGFIVNAVKSRDELEKVLNKIDSAKLKPNYKEALAQLQVLAKQVEKLIKTNYSKSPLQISKRHFENIILKEIQVTSGMIK